MIVDTSVLVSILRSEEDALSLWQQMSGLDEGPSLSAGNYLEVGMVIDRDRNIEASARIEELLDDLDVTVEPVTPAQARLARRAYRQFGKGSGHPAKLNYGDCFAYALAIDRNEPLLFKGRDFAQTDVRRA
jgi:ribonuclease VapC